MTVDQESAQLGYGPAKHDPQGLLMSQLARDTLAIVLAGGRGSRLGPLTDWRAKPAVRRERTSPNICRRKVATS